MLIPIFAIYLVLGVTLSLSQSETDKGLAVVMFWPILIIALSIKGLLRFFKEDF